MLHYFGAFVYVLFPLAFTLMYLLIGPMPGFLKRPAHYLVDRILYSSVQIGYLSLSVFNIVVLVSGFTAFRE